MSPDPNSAAPVVPPDTGDTRFLRLPAERLLEDWKEAYERAEAYLEALGLPSEERSSLATLAVERAAARPWPREARATAETLSALRDLLPEAQCPGADLAPGPRRVEPAVPGGEPPAPRDGAGEPKREEEDGSRRFRSMPALARASMAPHRFERRGLRRRISAIRRAGVGSHAQGEADGHAVPPTETADPRRRRRLAPWARAAARRRSLLALLVLIPSLVASGSMANLLPHQGSVPLEVAIVVCFGALFGWISIGFWTAAAGWITLLRRRDPFRITCPDRDPSPAQPLGGARTAVVMPICDEPVERVFAGLRATHQSLERTGLGACFDFFVLSDTTDPGTWVREEEAWHDWRRDVGRPEGIFYRRRRVRVERKSGNIADFCRRWGGAYRYMVVLDADSVMAGETLVRLVRMMETHPDAGLIQTMPIAANRLSLFARLQQFAHRLYGPVFAAGMHFWQLGDGHYWGHNAIIRVKAFMAHCGLPRLSGKPPLGGEILSHDFVEAALLGRGGWTLWLAYDLPGSYEEIPPSLLDELKRDRRWCQGNLQHLRLLFTEGFYGAHRALFLNGALSYVSAILWFCFLALGSAAAIVGVVREPDYFPHGRSLFPEWPIWRPDWALWLLAATLVILFLPKLLGVSLVLLRGRNGRAFGGGGRLCASVCCEILASSLLAPIRMVFHTKFVITNLMGRTVTWRSHGRGESETTWTEAIRAHGTSTVVASTWGLGMHWLDPAYFWWLTPIVAALIVSVPLSVLASRVSMGERARRLGLFLIPEETSPPRELRELAQNLEVGERRARDLPAAERDGFVRAVVDPRINALHLALLGPHRSLRPSIQADRLALVSLALACGPGALDARARRTLLMDPERLAFLHAAVWALPGEQARPWGRPARAAPGPAPADSSPRTGERPAPAARVAPAHPALASG
jgi:membrane glycosyltransferase